MPRKPRPVLAPVSGQLEFALPSSSRLEPLVSTLANRLASWGWLDKWRQVQRGEPVSKFHQGMVRATLQYLSGRGPQGGESDE
jgi:hypothetical protein